MNTQEIPNNSDLHILNYAYSPINDMYNNQRIINPIKKNIIQYGIRLIKVNNNLLNSYNKIRRINKK